MTNIKKTLQKGFTLIELLVVIAIIGILAGVLLLAINPSEQTRKANDAKIKTSLSQMRTQAALEFTGINDYSSVCLDSLDSLDSTKTYALYNAARDAETILDSSATSDCLGGEEFYVAWVALNNPLNSAFCVDLTGFAGEIQTMPADDAVKCE